MKHPNPAIATQAAVQRLPRWVLLALCTVYVVAGYVGRDAWKSNDIAAFGIMKLMALGQSDWWAPRILGIPADITGWLPYWLGAVGVALAPSHPELASRLPHAAALALTFHFTWQAVYHFALLKSAQPVAFAFGGQAKTKDYARALADSGLLALMACLGLAQLSHEATPHVFQAAAVAALLQTVALAAQPLTHGIRFPWRATVSSSALALSGQPMLAAGFIALLAVVQHQTEAQPAASASHSPAHRSVNVAIARATSALLTACFIGLALLAGPDWGPQIPTSWESIWTLTKLLTWFTWPAWPLAIWTLWRWRQHLLRAHLALPFGVVGLTLTNSLMQAETNRLLMLSLPALCVLAAFALPTLRRSMTALIDWFSVLFFSAGAIAIWVVWLAMQTGTPAKPAANVARLAPDFSPQFNGWTLAVAAAASALWMAVVAWRVGRHPPYIWKSLVLPAGGSVLCWLLLMTLWLPLLDHGRSYRALALRVSAQIDANQCAYAPDLTLAQVVGLAHYGHVDLERTIASRPCQYLVTSDTSSPYSLGLNGSEWLLKARLNRLNERQERLLLFTRTHALAAPNAEPPKEAGEHDPQATAR